MNPGRPAGLPVYTDRVARQHKDASWESQFDLPSAWTNNAEFLDTNLVYGLALPRQVISTAVSRANHTAGQPLQDLRLVDVLHNPAQNWSLRLLANGKACSLELFRSRQECYFSSFVSKMIRERKMDFNVLLSSVAQKNGLSSDLAVWENRQEALNALAVYVVDHLAELVPEDPSRTMMDRLRALEMEKRAAQDSGSDRPARRPSGATAHAHAKLRGQQATRSLETKSNHPEFLKGPRKRRCPRPQGNQGTWGGRFKSQVGD